MSRTSKFPIGSLKLLNVKSLQLLGDDNISFLKVVVISHQLGHGLITHGLGLLVVESLQDVELQLQRFFEDTLLLIGGGGLDLFTELGLQE